jgi:hypothetical protein
VRSQHLVRELFGRFHSLNLAVLREDLRRAEVAFGDWSGTGTLCPLAHGLSAGQLICELRHLSQAVDLQAACRAAARWLGTKPIHVYDFVRQWDDGGQRSLDWLAQQLDALWKERLADADCLQTVLARGTNEVPAETIGLVLV